MWRRKRVAQSSGKRRVGSANGETPNDATTPAATTNRIPRPSLLLAALFVAIDEAYSGSSQSQFELFNVLMCGMHVTE